MPWVCRLPILLYLHVLLSRLPTWGQTHAPTTTLTKLYSLWCTKRTSNSTARGALYSILLFGMQVLQRIRCLGGNPDGGSLEMGSLLFIFAGTVRVRD